MTSFILVDATSAGSMETDDPRLDEGDDLGAARVSSQLCDELRRDAAREAGADKPAVHSSAGCSSKRLHSSAERERGKLVPGGVDGVGMDEV